MSYTETSLKSDLQAWNADTGTDYSNALNSIITLAEARVATESDLNRWRKYATATLTASDPYVALPSDFIVARHFHLINSGTRTELREKQADWITDYAPDRTETGTPKYWAHWDDSNFLLAPTPDDTYSVELAYTKRPTTLVGQGASTTWLSSYYGNVLFGACMYESMLFLKEDQPDIDRWKGYYTEALAAMVIEQTGRNRRTEARDGEFEIERR